MTLPEMSLALENIASKQEYTRKEYNLIDEKIEGR